LKLRGLLNFGCKCDLQWQGTFLVDILFSSDRTSILTQFGDKAGISQQFPATYNCEMREVLIKAGGGATMYNLDMTNTSP